MVTNVQRAAWAKKGLDLFSKSTGITDEDLETQMSDFLCDLFHLADLASVDLNHVFRGARETYLEEVQEEKEVDVQEENS